LNRADSLMHHCAF